MPRRRPTSGDGWSRAARRRRGPLGSPVVLLAMYSIAGIALIVLAVNLLSGSFSGSDDPAPVAPAADRVPVEEPASATPTPAATAAPSVSDFELAQREEAAADAREAAIAARRARRAGRPHGRAAQDRTGAPRPRRPRTRTQEGRSARAPQRLTAGRGDDATRDGARGAAPAQPAPAPSGGGGGGGGGSCEFCIG